LKHAIELTNQSMDMSKQVMTRIASTLQLQNMLLSQVTVAHGSVSM
jgi:hypothetical protein